MMNKKQLFIAAVVGMLSVSGVNATDITGVAGSGGVYNITPSKVNGDVGYRQYTNFDLSEGDIANLIFKYGDSRDIETFINLVNNGVTINGIVNTMRDGNFYNGHAIFITPSGLTVGASGVLNVGSLSVITPTQDKYNSLEDEYETGFYTNINQVSKLLNSEANVGTINIEGKVFARNGVQLRGGDVNISGAVINGVAESNALTTAAQAETLFNSLVNTDGISSASAFTSNGSNIQIKSSTGTDVSGTIVNGAAVAGQTDSGLYITNSGNNGIKISGLLQSTNELNVYNKAGELNIATSGTIKNTGADLNISNSGTNLSVSGKLSTNKNLAITNNGSGQLTIKGSAEAANGAANIINEGSDGMNISGTVKGNTVRIVNRAGEMVISNTSNKVAATETLRLENSGTSMEVAGVTAGDLVSIENKQGSLRISGDVSVDKGAINIANNSDKGQLVILNNGNIAGNGTVSIKNKGTNGLIIAGTITNKAQSDTAISNEAGMMGINGNIDTTGNLTIKNSGSSLIISGATIANTGKTKIKNYGTNGLTIAGDINTNGSLSIYNDAGKLEVSDNGSITNENGDLAVKNQGTGGMTIAGIITNKSQSDTAISNEDGAMEISGNIDTTGNLTVKNSGTGLKISETATIANTGKTKIKNYGTNGLTIAGEINTNGGLSIYNDAGQLEVENNGSITNENGNLVLYSRNDSTGISTSVLSKITNKGTGNLAIKHNGTTASGSNGMDLQGTINNEGETAINNYSGNMYVAGDINSDGNLGIINRDGGGSMTVDSNIKSDTANINIKNYGSGDMTVNGTITHTGRVNVLANTGKLNLGATVNNNSNGALDSDNGFYAAARQQGTGINVTSDFELNGTGQNLIKNITGEDGLTFDGTVNTSGAQTELYNMTGDMTVGGNINTTTGNAVILNKGDKMTVNGTVSSTKDVKVVNKGSVEADVSKATVNQDSKWFYEQLK